MAGQEKVHTGYVELYKLQYFQILCSCLSPGVICLVETGPERRGGGELAGA